MITVDFYPKKFHEIPKQDNPAFGDDECMMIVADAKVGSHAVVLRIKPDPIESVTSVAKFWQHSDAVRYCDIVDT